MNINQVRYFVLVHDCHSFSAAAKMRGISVQAVSKAVGELEREVGCDLLARSSKGVIATQAGKAFYQRARLAVSAFDNLENFSFTDATKKPEGPIRVALCSPNFDKSAELLHSLSTYFQKASGVEFNLELADVRDAQLKLSTGAYDALVTIGTYEHEGTECYLLGKLPTGIRVAKNHPLAFKKSVTLEDLRKYPAGESAIIDDFNTSILQMYVKSGAIDNVERLDTISEETKDFMTERQGYFFSAIFPFVASAETQLLLIPIDSKESIRVPICIVVMQGHMTSELECVRSLMMQGAGFGSK